jgi:hypothetical protein
MTSNLASSNMRINLNGKQMLIVEEDEGLISRWKRSLTEINISDKELVIIRNIVEAQQELCKNGMNYRIIIVDVMLPLNSKKLEEISKILEDLQIIRNEFLLHENQRNTTSETQEKYEKARERRPILLEQINGLLVEKGGIELIDKWLINNLSSHPPILFITCKSEDYIKELGYKAAHWKNVAWVVKPITGRIFIESIQDMLNNYEGE